MHIHTTAYNDAPIIYDDAPAYNEPHAHLSYCSALQRVACVSHPSYCIALQRVVCIKLLRAAGWVHSTCHSQGQRLVRLLLLLLWYTCCSRNTERCARHGYISPASLSSVRGLNGCCACCVLKGSPSIFTSKDGLLHHHTSLSRWATFPHRPSTVSSSRN